MHVSGKSLAPLHLERKTLTAPPSSRIAPGCECVRGHTSVRDLLCWPLLLESRRRATAHDARLPPRSAATAREGGGAGRRQRKPATPGTICPATKPAASAAARRPRRRPRPWPASRKKSLRASVGRSPAASWPTGRRCLSPNCHGSAGRALHQPQWHAYACSWPGTQFISSS